MCMGLVIKRRGRLGRILGSGVDFLGLYIMDMNNNNNNNENRRDVSTCISILLSSLVSCMPVDALSHHVIALYPKSGVDWIFFIIISPLVFFNHSS